MVFSQNFFAQSVYFYHKTNDTSESLIFFSFKDSLASECKNNYGPTVHLDSSRVELLCSKVLALNLEIGDSDTLDFYNSTKEEFLMVSIFDSKCVRNDYFLFGKEEMVQFVDQLIALDLGLDFVNTFLDIKKKLSATSN